MITDYRSVSRSGLLQDIRCFVRSILLDGGTLHEPITKEDAAYTMTCWDDDDVECPEGMTPDLLANIWNIEII